MTGGPEFDLGGHISGELFGVFGLLPFEVILRSCHSICIREGEQERVLLPLVGFSFDDPSNIGVRWAPPFTFSSQRGKSVDLFLGVHPIPCTPQRLLLALFGVGGRGQ